MSKVIIGSKKRLRILLTPEPLQKFGIKVGDTYLIQSEAQGEEKYGYCIYPKKVGAIVIYKHECEVL